MKATGMNGSGNRFLFCMLFRAGKGKTETDRRLYFITQERDRQTETETETKRRGCTSGGVMCLVFACMPSESHHRRLRSLLLYLCYVFQALINSFVC